MAYKPNVWTEDKVQRLRELDALGIKNADIAQELGVTRKAITQKKVQLNYAGAWHKEVSPYAGEVKCLFCGEKFMSVDRRHNRLHRKCKNLESNHGQLGETYAMHARRR